MQMSPNYPSAPVGGGLPAGTARRAPSRRRLVSAILLAVTTVLLLVSAFTAWWVLSESVGSASVSLSFLPGNSVTASTPNGTATGSYSEAGLGALSSLYEAVLGILLAAAALTGLGAAVGLLTEFGILRGRTRGKLLTGLAVVVAVVALSAALLAPTSQPGQFQTANPGNLCTDVANYSGSTPCNSFWGSISSGGASITWGAGIGWYMAVLGFVFAAAGGVLWRSGRQDSWEELPAELLYSIGGPSASPLAPPPAYSMPTYASPPSLAPGPDTVPPANVLASSVVLYRIYVMKQKIDLGQLTPEEFSSAKSQLLSEPGLARTAPAPPSSRQQDMVKLDWLADHQAVTHPEYLELRRRIILGI